MLVVKMGTNRKKSNTIPFHQVRFRRNHSDQDHRVTNRVTFADDCDDMAINPTIIIIEEN